MWMTLSLAALAVGLAMDAFAVAVAQGASVGGGIGRAVRIGSAFGIAQAGMPLLGWLAGIGFVSVVRSVDHWVVLLLLGFLGARMIREALSGEGSAERGELVGWALASAAFATSIDALAAGITLPTLQLPVLLACAAIGGATAFLCAGGVVIGRMASRHVGRWAELAGGLILISLGAKIFVEHQFFGA